MFTVSELWSVSQRQGRYKLLQPWWEVFMDYLVLLMLMLSVLAGTLLLSQDGVVCVPTHSHPSNTTISCDGKVTFRPEPLPSSPPSPSTGQIPAKGVRTNLDYQQYVYVSQVCYHKALPWFSRFLPYVTLLQSLLLLAAGCFWFHFPLTSARIEHFLAILAKCCESPWTSRALSCAAWQDGMPRCPVEEEQATGRQVASTVTRQPNLDSGTDSPLLARMGSVSQPSPCPSSPSHCSTHSSLSLIEITSLSLTAPVVPEGSRPGPILDRSDGEQARALFERVRRFRAHCESSDIIYKVYTAQTVFKVLKFVVIVSYTAPLLGSISFSHICQPLSYALTGYHVFQCSHSLASILRKLMQTYVCLLGLYGLLGIYTLFWIFHKSLRQYSFRRLRETGSMLDAPDLNNDLAFLLHMTDQYDPLLAQRLSVFLSPVSETRLMEENLERRWSTASLRAMITSDHQGRSVLQLVDVPRLPPALFSLSDLEVLKLELIGDAKLPAQISNMTALRELHLYHCPVAVEPSALVVLQERLESLRLTFAHAAEIPGWVYSLRGLRELHLSGCVSGEGGVGRGWALASLRALRRLRVLRLHAAVLRVPAELSEVAASLVRLEVRNEGVRLLALAGLRRLEGLLELELQGCRLKRLPSALLALSGLRCLDLSDNGLRTLEELLALRHLGRLTSLRLARNRVQVLPSGVGMLHSLELLDLAHNHLRRLPAALFTLRRLRRLLLAGNLLDELPADIGALVLLVELDLSGNRLESLPRELFANCVELRELNVSRNSLGLLPHSLGALRRLSLLDVRGNNLEDLPAELGSCSRLRGGGLLAENWLLRTLPRHVRDSLQQPTSASRTSAEVNCQPDSDCFPAFSTMQWNFLSAVESRI